MNILRTGRRRATGVVVVVATAATVQAVAMALPASAAGLTVSTTADVATNFGACGNSGQTSPTGGSLREAICVANNLGATASTITVPAGTYHLTNGELQMGKVAGSNITLNGAGQASTIIDAGGLSRVLDLDPGLVGGVTTSISAVTISGGTVTTIGGAGIIAGSAHAGTIDTLTIASSSLTNNHVTSAASNDPGGALQFIGGALTITNSTISGNSSGSSPGSAVFYAAEQNAAGEQMSITGNTISGNTLNASVSNVNVGGALSTEKSSAVPPGGPALTMNVSGTDFSGNKVIGSGTGIANGAGIFASSGTLTVTGSTFTGNSVTGGANPSGGAMSVLGGAVAVHYSRFTGNVGANGSAVSIGAGSGATVDAADNWWGCNAGPGTAGCDTVAGGPTVAPRLVLTATASPATVVGPNAASTVTAALTQDSGGAGVSGTNLGAFNGVPVGWSDPLPSGATVAAASSNISAGTASTAYNSHGASGPGHVLATLDNSTVTATITVDQAPAITSASAVTVTKGTAATFTVTTTGYPVAAISKTGTTPPGMTFTDNGDGTATLTGTPTAGGTFPLTLTAANGVSPNATQTLTVTVHQPPAFTSSTSASFTTGAAGSFTITTTGTPTAAISTTGTLPTGVTFTDNGNGTATLAGTPAADSGGAYPLTVTAANGVSPDATQTLTVTVNQAPTVTSNPADQSVNPGASVSFTAAATGFPTPTVQWQRSISGASFSNIAGATSSTYTFTAATGDNGNQYRAVFTNTTGSATSTAATLTVSSAPTISSADTTAFTVGTAGTFTVTTSGFPNPTLSTTGTLPAWLSFTDNGDGTATIAGTPPAGSGGTYGFTIQADNGTSPSASQAFTLTVNESPAISSADHTTFQAGTAGSFPVTTLAGFPTATTVSETGTLPSGVTFTDNGDGTATLAGTPAAGTAGTYPITITADNGASTPATQSFTLTVLESPTITSADHATFSVGSAGTFSVTSSGAPTTTISFTGALPTGVTFTPSGTGATIAGTPAPDTGGTYPITLTASDGVTPNTTQAFTLTVNQPPRITSADHASFVRGAAGSFTVTAAPGVPAATTLTETGTLPAGVTFTDNGDGTATVAGTPTASGSFPLTLTASNGVAPDATQTFTLTVNQAPDITSADHTTFTVGAAANFTVTTNPAADTVTESGALPAGVTFADNGDGTATLAGTPAADTGGSYPLSVRATNPTGFTTQVFTLTVTDVPAVVSANHTTFTIGTAGTFTVTTRAGFPAATTVTEAGALPSGVTFADNGDGTATLAGTPAVGADGSYPLTLTATNTIGHQDQAFTLNVARAAQTITVTSADPGTDVVGHTYTPAATSDSGLPVTYTIDAATTNNACSYSAPIVSLDHAGWCVIDFTQPGNGTYAAAAPVQIRIQVVTVTTATTVATANSPTVYGQPASATATVTIGTAVGPAGTVQFAVDGVDVGVPVVVDAVGRATSPDLTGGPTPRTPGSYTVTATFTPTDTARYASSHGEATQVVDKAGTAATVAVTKSDVTATVTPVTPGAGTPTGSVAFSVAGTSVGTALLSNGVATLGYEAPSGQTVTAVYGGGADFTGSSASTTRVNPTITATVTSTTPPTRYGWYRSAVTVTFSCTSRVALTNPCPAPVTLSHEGTAQSVTRTITTIDGGTATVAVSVNIDLTPPTVSVSGVPRSGVASNTPTLTCVGRDSLSGVASCLLTQRHSHGVTRYTATATDKAGNTATTTGSLRSLIVLVAASRESRGAFRVAAGHSYTLVAYSPVRPRYYDAAVYPLAPTRADRVFHASSPGRWTLRVTFRSSMRGHRYWYLGVHIRGVLRVVKLCVT